MSPFVSGTLPSCATIDVVCTTIGDGSFLKHYAREITDSWAQHRVRMIVIPDRKTPPALYEAAAGARAEGISILCPDPGEQEQFLASAGAGGMFPWDSDGRRNIGYLMAWRDGADIMISIDDDNLPAPGWLKEHEVVAAPPADHDMAGSEDGGFWNPCNLLASHPAGIYARGYPYSRRRQYPLNLRRQERCEVAVNAGLWIGDPDVDAITRLAAHPVTTALAGSRVLAKGTWAPVNSQNTAVRREVIPAYCYFESAKRFADIWQGYFAQACAQHLGHHVRFGTPAADCSVRNDHDLLRDLALEYDGIMMADQVLDWLTGVKLSGSTYAEAYECLRGELLGYVSGDALSQRAHGLMYDVTVRMGDWLNVIHAIGA